jgi:hypothetical protein
MLLTNDKNLVKEFVKINFINSTSSFPNWENAADRYLRPIIGDALYEAVSDYDDTATDAQKELKKKCQAVVAPLAYLIELPAIHAQLTDSGLRVISTENMPAAHKWEFNEIKEWLKESGAFAIEALLRYLFKNKGDYEAWTDSEEYKQVNALVFKTGEEFKRYFNVAEPHRVFWELKPLIKEVEDFYIESAIGEAFYTELKGKAAPSAEEAKALELIKKAVAQLTIVKAVEKLTVKITERGFTVLISAGNPDAANSGDAQAQGYGLSMLHDSCEKTGDAYLLKLKEYLNATASADVFKTFFESDPYVAPTVVAENPNKCRKIFGM